MTNQPLVSLLVAMRNEADYISACVASLLNQDYPQDRLEVLIYDGQSEDNSKSIVENLIRNRKNYQVLDNPKRIQSAAWNLGVQECKGEIISIVSGHAEFAPDYVSRAVETLLRTKADMAGGTVRARSQGILGEAIAWAISTPFGVGGARFRYTDKEELTDTVFMGFCRRAVYEKIGGFDEELVRNQDDEFSNRLVKAGGKIICNPNIISYYYNRATFGSLWRQYYQYGLWKVRVLQKHYRQMSLRQFVPPAFVLALIGSAFLALSPFLRPLSLIIPVLYLFNNLGASFLTASNRDWRFLPLLPIIFAILHLSYGSGFVVGLVKFWNRWGDNTGGVPVWSNEPAE
jgi:glycosyltransferase involved in cell wall biosynthesis